MIKATRLGTALLLLFSMLIPTTSFAAITYTTLPGPDGGGWCFGNGNLAAVGVRIPAGSDYTLNQIQVKLHDTSGGGTPFTISVYDNNSGLPGSAVATIGSGTGTTTFGLYTLTPSSPITLLAGTTYWITASSSSTNSCAFGWSYIGTDPTGSFFTYVGEEQYYSGGAWNNRDGSYQQLEINATPASAPLPIPTLSTWGLLLLAMSILLITAFYRRPE